MGGHPVAARRSSRPHRDSAPTPRGCTRWVDTVSLGKVARSTTSTRYPFRASNIAVGEPAQRAPTTIASNALVILAFSYFDNQTASIHSPFVPAKAGTQGDT